MNLTAKIRLVVILALLVLGGMTTGCDIPGRYTMMLVSCSINNMN